MDCKTINPTAAKFNDQKVDKGTKSMSDLMNNNGTWAKSVIKADAAPVANAQALNPTLNSAYTNAPNENVYGVMTQGIAIDLNSVGSMAKDKTVQETIKEWGQLLATSFPARNSYKVSDLPVMIAALTSTATRLDGLVKGLHECAEITDHGRNAWQNITAGMRSFADGIASLRTAVCSKEGVTSVELDIPAKRH